ncbi:major facilitator superfamily domain-containing protein [Podospora australis]|uniref:Major facilitator superfamily domain-containing protein n=1 Tax=Podospora australis TaxID=1536484 RepID=A0AAN7AIM5_9PEZI|nr:major facilitator superfamily domain-containing protein [Podospora australis]
MSENEPSKEANQDNTSEESSPIPEDATSFKPTARFWAILATLAVIGLLSALENTVVTTALPHIVTELNLGENYIWVTNVFFLTGAAVQPLFGQLANIFGRRWVTMVIVALFTLGSGIAGGASNGAMLIAGRAVQGMGAGGIYIIIDIIISDLVPLRQRGNYIAVILVIYTIGLAIGPWVGGEIVATTTWRWVFYINLPIGALSLLLIYLFLHVTHTRTHTLAQKLRRIDILGNILLISSTVSILYALTYANTSPSLSWSSPHILTPLLLGLCLGLPSFIFYERFPLEPIIPTMLFRNRTSALILADTFLNSALLYWVLFFLPVYFQAVLGASPPRAGVLLLPAIPFGLPGAVVAVLLMTKFGRYKPLHLIGFGANLIGMGLFTLLDQSSSLATVVLFQAVAAVGSGFVLNTLLPAVQAQLEEKYQAQVTAAWSFMRSFGSIWGVAIPAAILGTRFEKLARERIADEQVLGMLLGDGGDGGNGNKGYENAYAEFIWGNIQGKTREVVVGVYVDALKLIWYVSMGFAAVNLLVAVFEREVVLRTELETEYEMVEGNRDMHGDGRKRDEEEAVTGGEEEGVEHR